jgi:glycosyltransferase involved in cell wall biosynthesis
MRILLSAYACEPNRGSEPGYGWNLAYHLALRGHDVHVLTRLQGQSAIAQELNHQQLPNLQFHFVDIPKWSRSLKHQVPYYLHYMLWQRAALAYSADLVNTIDILHHVTWGTLRIGSHLWKFGKPFVFGPVGGGQVAPRAFASFFGSYWSKELLRSYLVYSLPYLPAAKTLVKKVGLFLASNTETYKQLEKMRAHRVKLFCDSALPEDFYPGTLPVRAPCNRLRILWVGGITPYKGLELALASLQNLRFPFHLNILGDGTLGPNIPQWVTRYDLQGKVHWRGKVSWAQVKHYYEISDVFLFTSLRESFGGQLLEAMAFCLPVITLDHFGARDFVPREAGFKIPVTSPEHTKAKIAEALEILWNSPSLRISMGKAAYEFAKTQSWDQKVIQIENIYRELLKH